VNVSTHGDATRREPSETGADDAAGDGLTRIEAEEHRRFLHLADAHEVRDTRGPVRSAATWLALGLDHY